MPAPPAPAAPPARRPHPALIGGGVLVVALGFGLPRLLSDPVGPAAAATPPTDPAATPAGPGIGAALARLAAG
ncbi:MAG TPA: hypothetical protein VH092_24755, partial [Urbifossiella sp.]|nr:hypothetical protein [Urbifossiella sp.]